MDFGQMSDSMGGGREADREERYGDFVRRYEEGTSPYDEIPDEEVLALYREVAPDLKGEDFRRAAREVFSTLSPEERAGFGRQLRDLSLQEGEELPLKEDEQSLEDPDALAWAAERAHDECPGILGELLVGGGTGFVGGATGDGMAGGDGASGAEGGMASNPATKTVVVGLTAIAAREAARR